MLTNVKRINEILGTRHVRTHMHSDFNDRLCKLDDIVHVLFVMVRFGIVEIKLAQVVGHYFPTQINI